MVHTPAHWGAGDSEHFRTDAKRKSVTGLSVPAPSPSSQQQSQPRLIQLGLPLFVAREQLVSCCGRWYDVADVVQLPNRVKRYQAASVGFRLGLMKNAGVTSLEQFQFPSRICSYTWLDSLNRRALASARRLFFEVQALYVVACCTLASMSLLKYRCQKLLQLQTAM